MSGLAPAAGHLDLLASLSAASRNALLVECVEKRISKGRVIWNQGDKAGHVAFLVEGAAMSTFNTPNGKMGVTGIWFPGDMLGAADLCPASRRQLTLKAIQDTRIYLVQTLRFMEICVEYPEISQAVIQALSARLRWVAHLALALETQNAFGCVCTILIGLAQRFAVPTAEGMLLDLSITNENLASFAGVTRQRVYVTLRELSRLGVIQVKRRKITLVDARKLEALIYTGNYR